MKAVPLIFLLTWLPAQITCFRSQTAPVRIADTLYSQQLPAGDWRPDLVNWYAYDETNRLIHQQTFQRSDTRQTISKTADLRTRYLPSGLTGYRSEIHFSIDGDGYTPIADEYIYEYGYQQDRLSESYFSINHYDRWPGLPRLLWTEHQARSYDNRGCLAEMTERVRNAAEKEDWRFTQRQAFLNDDNCQATGIQYYEWHTDSSKWRLDQYEARTYNGQGLILDRLRHTPGGELLLEEHTHYNQAGRITAWTGWYRESGNRYRTTNRYEQDTLLVYNLEEASFPEKPWFGLNETQMVYRFDGQLAERRSNFGWNDAAGRWEGHFNQTFSYDTQGNIIRDETDHRIFDRSLFPAEVLQYHEHYENQYAYRCDGVQIRQRKHYLEPNTLFTGHEYLPPDQLQVFRYSTPAGPCLPEEPEKDKELILYPTPANERLTLRSPMTGQPGAFYRIWDMHGREVHAGPLGQWGSGAEIDTGGLAPGVYLLELTAGPQKAVRLFLIAR